MRVVIAWTGDGLRERRNAIRRHVVTPRRVAISSARMLIAISPGVTAPMSRPIGAWTRSRHSASASPRPAARADPRHLRAAADEAQVAEVARRERAHASRSCWWPRVRIVDVGGRWESRALEPRGDGSTTTSAAGEALGVGELLAVVDDDDPEARFGGRPREMPADVAGADDVERGCRFEGIDVDVHAAAADEAVLLREIVVQLVVEQGLAARGDRRARLEGRFVLVAAAADRADGAAIGVDEHLGARTLGRGALRADDGDQRDLLAALERPGSRGEDFFVQTRTSIFAFFLTSSMKACARACLASSVR
jgi:hypothetical protein